MTPEPAARRPLKSRSTAWAAFFSRRLLRLGLTPNTVSMLSLVCAAAGGASVLAAANWERAWVFWFVAAVGIQLRLFCNMMDGMLAVEGGLKSATGELFNEIPDRLGDAMILVPLGYAGGTSWTIALGWMAAWGAAFTAYVRVLGASRTQRHDFCGPMAKPHRMAAATLACLGMMTLELLKLSWPLILGCLVIINAGIGITLGRRIGHLAARLKQSPIS